MDMGITPFLILVVHNGHVHTCSVEGCDDPHTARGFCKRHYRRWRRHGDPLGGRRHYDLHALATETEKVCTSCEQLKPLNEFAPTKHGFMGRAAKCRVCWNAYISERGARPEVKARRRAFEGTRERRDKVRLAQVRRKLGDVGASLERARLRPTATCMVCGRRSDEVHTRARGRAPLISLCIDHDHDDLAVRGILCRSCNLAVGYTDDDPARLRALADYLEADPEPRIASYLEALDH